MTIRIIKHEIELQVNSFDEKTKVATVKLFGTMQKFRKDEYEIVEEKKMKEIEKKSQLYS